MLVSENRKERAAEVAINHTTADIRSYIPSTSVLSYYKTLSFISNSEEFLSKQIAKANEFINHPTVQAEVTADFDAGEYESFDVNHGDNNCQSRIFLKNYFIKREGGIRYEQLEAQEKLVLSLSHITAKYKHEVRDELNIPIEEKASKVCYGKVGLASFKVAVKNNDVVYSVGDLIGLSISEFSVSYMSSLARSLTREDIAQDLTPYNRKVGKTNKIAPSQQLQAPGMLVLFKVLAESQDPIVFKVTKIVATEAEDKQLEYASQGTEFVVSRVTADEQTVAVPAEERTALSKKAVVFCELFACITPSLQARLKNTVFEKLASTASCAEYCKELQAIGIGKILHVVDHMLDCKLQGREVQYKSGELQQADIDSVAYKPLLEGAYSYKPHKDSYLRSRVGTAFTCTHLFVSTLAAQEQHVQSTPITDKVGSLISIKKGEQNGKSC